MEFWFWLRRLLGRPALGAPCTLCHRMIPPGDLEKGIAIIVARRQYCKGCVQEVTRRPKGQSSAAWNLSASTGSSSSVLGA